nr:uncharacterized protein LOC111415472 [Onthophagus taurus]
MDFPKFRPENEAGRFLLSKKILKSYQDIHPDSNYIRDTPQMYKRLAWDQKRIKENTLTWKRQSAIEFRSKLDHVAYRWIQKANDFKKLIKKSNKFVMGNAEKRARTRIKILNELNIQEKRDADIEKLQTDYNNLSQIKCLMENKLKSLKMYEDYLEEVAKKDNFRNINNILIRFYDLLSTKDALSKKIIEYDENLFTLKGDFAKLLEEKRTKLNGISHHLGLTYQTYENARANSLRLEGLVAKIQKVCVRKRAEHIGLKKAIWSWYQKVCQMRGDEIKVKEWDIEAQLEYIGSKFGELAVINSFLQRERKQTKFI